MTTFYPVKYRCPECGHVEVTTITSAGIPPFDQKYARPGNPDKNEEALVYLNPSGVSKCERCGMESYYRLYMRPDVRVYKMTEMKGEEEDKEGGEEP